MTPDFQSLTHPRIQQLHPYIPGKSIYEVSQQYGTTDIIKLGSNENPFGCSHHVVSCLKQLDVNTLSHYPVYAHHPFFQQLSSHLKIDTRCLTLANGSDALFGFLMIAFALGQDKHVMTHDYAFSTYEIQANTYGIPIIRTPIDDWQVNIDAMIKACTEKTALIFIANPNNPTGGLIAIKDIQRLLNQIPATTLLVLDEAYTEYLPATHSALSLQTQYPNLVITRTFSKAYGLAGLRLGYAIAHPHITAILKKIHLPFSVNIAALTAASAALDDQDFVQKTRETTLRNRQILIEQLSQNDIEHLPANANFLTIDCGQDSVSLVQALEKNGIIVRPLHPYGLPNYIRVTIGTDAQTQSFLQVFLTLKKQLRS